MAKNQAEVVTPIFSEPTQRENRFRLAPEVSRRIVRKAVLSRRVEERLLDLFSQGKLFGTVHTCIGQEFSGAVLTEFLSKGDSIFSNHRCHGHFLSFTGDVNGLMAELMGKPSGVCAGRGGSQHLCKDGFYSNGIQGSIVPVAAGLAFARKIKNEQKISVVFIGDGTLGEGAIYEAANIASKWDLPLLIVLENNMYAQSTHQSETLAGDIRERFSSFGLKTIKADTWDWDQLYSKAKDSVDYVRKESKPAFLQIDTFRLKAHSKGDDNRPRSAVEPYEIRDPLNVLIKESSAEIVELQNEIMALVDQAVDLAEKSSQPSHKKSQSSVPQLSWKAHQPSKQRLVKALNDAFTEIMEKNPKVLFIGEDVKSPYGGAFKVSQGLSDKFPTRVMNTPISEGAIAGIGTGLAMDGFRPFIEIMFGDFMSLAFDIILNSASKFEQMYNDQVEVNVVFRTPMGGGRGYGPTHSQTLDRHFFGIPGLRVVALNNFMEPKLVLEPLVTAKVGPTLLIENKLLYSSFLRHELPQGFKLWISDELFPTVHIEPESANVDLAIITYGGMSEPIMEVVNRLFDDHDIVARVICPTQVFPFDVRSVLNKIGPDERVVVVEEGQGFAGFGAEIVSQLAECERKGTRVKRVFASPEIIPAAGALEKFALPTIDSVIAETLELFK